MIITTTITMKIGKLWYNIINNSKENKLRNYVSISKCRKEACKKFRFRQDIRFFFRLFFCNCVNCSSLARITALLDFHPQVKWSLFHWKLHVSVKFVVFVGTVGVRHSNQPWLLIQRGEKYRRKIYIQIHLEYQSGVVPRS